MSTASFVAVSPWVHLRCSIHMSILMAGWTSTGGVISYHEDLARRAHIRSMGDGEQTKGVKKRSNPRVDGSFWMNLFDIDQSRATGLS